MQHKCQDAQQWNRCRHRASAARYQDDAAIRERSDAVYYAAFSSDGKFLAYASNESGTEQIFVRSFSRPGQQMEDLDRRRQISRVVVRRPRRSHYDGELHNPERVFQPRAWSPTRVGRAGVGQNLDLSPDGKRVAALERPATVQAAGSLHAMFLLNFFDEVRRKIPAGKYWRENPN